MSWYGEADTAGENDDVVRIMTIHKSKGLEFPVVFVSGLGKGFNTQDTKSDLVIHEKLGLGLVEKTKSPRTKRPSLIRNEIESRIKRENLGEELRVLYVALTRAKEKIILTGGLSNAQKSFEKYRGNVNANQPISFGHKADAGNAIDDRHVVSVTRFQVIKHFRIALSGRFTFKISLIAYFDRCTRIVVGYFPVFNVYARYTVSGSCHNVMVVKS